MLKKVYLTPTLPETSGQFVSPKTNPDVVQKLDSYRREKQTYCSEAPVVRPHPLEKYDRKQEDSEDVIHAQDRYEQVMAIKENEAADMNVDDTSLATEARYEGVISTLPAHARQRAWRLLPFILNKDIGDLNIRDVLYDLCVKNVKKIHSTNWATLRSLYRQLDMDMTLPKHYFVKKPLPRNGTAAGSSIVKHSVRQSMMITPPGKRNLPSQAPPPRSSPIESLHHTKASSIGGTSLGDELGASGISHRMTSTPIQQLQEEDEEGDEDDESETRYSTPIEVEKSSSVKRRRGDSWTPTHQSRSGNKKKRANSRWE